MSNESYQQLMAFKKAAKRDISAFNILKDEMYFGVFHRSFKATSMTQGLLDVCDPNFEPKRGDPHEQQLFTGKQNFVYAVLLKTLQTDYGRALVREHEICMSSINTIQTLKDPELRSYGSPPLCPTSSSQTIGEELTLNSFSISKNNSGFWIPMIHR